MTHSHIEEARREKGTRAMAHLSYDDTAEQKLAQNHLDKQKTRLHSKDKAGRQETAGLPKISGFFRLRTFFKFTWLGTWLDLPPFNFEYLHKSGADSGNTETVGRDTQQLYPRYFLFS